MIQTWILYPIHISRSMYLKITPEYQKAKYYINNIWQTEYQPQWTIHWKWRLLWWLLPRNLALVCNSLLVSYSLNNWRDPPPPTFQYLTLGTDAPIIFGLVPLRYWYDLQIRGSPLKQVSVNTKLTINIFMCSHFCTHIRKLDQTP